MPQLLKLLASQSAPLKPLSPSPGTCAALFASRLGTFTHLFRLNDEETT